ncbi:MAG: hypothetical protein CL791_04110 [Chloroflexi bacterium]|nr:hypothetical protein [Chloroflexota bacterium]
MSRLVGNKAVISRFLIGLVVFLTLFVGGNTFIEKVNAHANQIRALPAPNSELVDSPDRVIIWYSEPIEDSFSVVTVLNSEAEQVDLGDSYRDSSELTAMSVSLPPLDDGTYTVVWKNLSAIDGHKVIGSYVFSVGEPISAGAQIGTVEQPLLQTVADPWLRWLIFLAAAIVLGGIAFETFVGVPVIFGDFSKDSWQGSAVAGSVVWSRFSIVALSVILLAIFGQLFQQSALVSGESVFSLDFEVLRSVVFDSNWGRLWFFRLITVFGILILFVLARRSQFVTQEIDGNEDESSLVGDSVLAPLVMVLGLVFVGLISASSHNAASDSDIKILAVSTDFIHLIAAMVWLGGVIYLAITVPVHLREMSSSNLSEFLKTSVSRFTLIAFLSAWILIVTGFFSSYMQVTTLSAVPTPYGWFLVAKVVLMVPLFTLAAVNGFHIVRHFGMGGEWAFKKSLFFETSIIVVIFVVVGWLASLEPARQYAGRMGFGFDDRVSFQDSDDGTVFDIFVEPAEVGKNNVTVQITKPNGDPIYNAVDVRIRLKFLDDDLGEPLVSLEYSGDGVWELRDAPLNIVGEYQAEVVVQRPDAFDSRTAFRFKAGSASTAGDAIAPDTDTTNLLFGIQVLLIGAMIVFLSMRKRFLPVLFGTGNIQSSLTFPGITLVVIGLFLVLNVEVLRLGLADELRNPFPPTAESVEIGEPIYFDVCASCHGDTGLGDGPVGSSLPKEPANLIIHVPLHSDTIIYEFVRDGISNAGMPGQEGVLSESEMWHLVNYIRAQFDK